ncbi:MAG: heavy metal-binding domain-containing protein [Clostridia bacterium]|nr:heavy metal-binding domain-containing protein [Clostridia bacterium]
MKLTTVTLYDVKDLGEVSGVCIYGMGLFTCICYLICQIIGKSSVFVGRKLDRAKAKAIEEMKLYAQEMGADGVMNLHYQLSGLSVMVYGSAFQYLDSEAAAPATEDAAPAEEAAE